MLRQHAHLMVTLLVLADACAVAAAWLGSYFVRFWTLPVDPNKGVPELADKFLPLLPLVIVVQLIIFWRLQLYRPRREDTIVHELRDIVKAFIVAVVAVVLIDYAMPASHKISRTFVATYAVLGASLFALFRGGVRAFLHAARRRGWNQRSAAIIGSGRAAQTLQQALQRNAWTGLQVQYFVDDPDAATPSHVRGIPVRGPLASVAEIIESTPVDCVYIALPTRELNRIDDVLERLEKCMADVRVVPYVSPAFGLRSGISELDGVPILSLRQTPLYGWNAILKRAFDVGVGLACLAIAAVPMLIIAALVKLSSPGPVFYRQRRMGLDGCEFDMFKFRSMRADAEASGAQWSQKVDPRRTAIGSFLRKTSMDELPNLFNVLRGEMSLVGPRPERPEFIAQFKHEIPRYMLRHKMKAGMTGYAQIHGYRGDTSLRKRIQHDVWYIQHWSLWLDLRILLRTVFGVWFSRHEA